MSEWKSLLMFMFVLTSKTVTLLERLVPPATKLKGSLSRNEFVAMPGEGSALPCYCNSIMLTAVVPCCAPRTSCGSVCRAHEGKWYYYQGHHGWMGLHNIHVQHKGCNYCYYCYYFSIMSTYRAYQPANLYGIYVACFFRLGCTTDRS